MPEKGDFLGEMEGSHCFPDFSLFLLFPFFSCSGKGILSGHADGTIVRSFPQIPPGTFHHKGLLSKCPRELFCLDFPLRFLLLALNELFLAVSTVSV